MFAYVFATRIVTMMHYEILVSYFDNVISTITIMQRLNVSNLSDTLQLELVQGKAGLEYSHAVAHR